MKSQCASSSAAAESERNSVASGRFGTAVKVSLFASVLSTAPFLLIVGDWERVMPALFMCLIFGFLAAAVYCAAVYRFSVGRYKITFADESKFWFFFGAIIHFTCALGLLVALWSFVWRPAINVLFS